MLDGSKWMRKTLFGETVGMGSMVKTEPRRTARVVPVFQSMIQSIHGALNVWSGSKEIVRGQKSRLRMIEKTRRRQF